jgi:hypothetical protein
MLNVIRRALKKHGFLPNNNPPNFVYMYPTPHALVDALIQVGSHHPDRDVELMGETPISMLESLLSKYTSRPLLKEPEIKHPLATNSDLDISNDVVLLTGSTGALGCAMLSILAYDSTVRKVYAINRTHKGQGDLKERQAKALHERGMDTSILQDPRIVLIEADISVDRLGLSDILYTQVSV